MGHGGARKGAGRPKSSEPTERIRVPAGMVDQIKQFALHGGLTLPMYESRIQAGYPSPGDDRMDDNRFDLGAFLVNDPEDSFMVYASGDSMKDAGIRDGDLMIVNRRMKPSNGKIVVAAVEGQMTVKYLIMKNKKAYLMPANPAYREIPVDSEHGVVIWGVVTRSIQAH